jgi:membrane protease YdiL (CAAX protease family)
MSKPFWIILIAQFIGAAGEELGWRCFLQPTFQTRMNKIIASNLVGFLWGIWHVGIFDQGWLYVLSFLLFTISISIILGELLSRTRDNNLIIATFIHTLINLGLLLLFKEESGNLFAMSTFAISSFIVAITIMFIFYTKSMNKKSLTQQ